MINKYGLTGYYSTLPLINYLKHRWWLFKTSLVCSGWRYSFSCIKFSTPSFVSNSSICIGFSLFQNRHHIRDLQNITNKCTIYLVLNCIQNKLQHVLKLQCTFFREFFCYTKVTCKLKCSPLKVLKENRYQIINIQSMLHIVLR